MIGFRLLNEIIQLMKLCNFKYGREMVIDGDEART
jgi:hypothetical protein